MSAPLEWVPLLKRRNLNEHRAQNERCVHSDNYGTSESNAHYNMSNKIAYFRTHTSVVEAN